MAMWRQKVILANFENVGRGHRLQNSYLLYYMTNCNQTFTKMMQLELATKASHQLTVKM